MTIRAVVTFAKVLSERVYIGRSSKRWISAVRRPRAKLLRDVFVVSFGVYMRVCVCVCMCVWVCAREPRRNHVNVRVRR